MRKFQYNQEFKYLSRVIFKHLQNVKKGSELFQSKFFESIQNVLLKNFKVFCLLFLKLHKKEINLVF